MIKIIITIMSSFHQSTCEKWKTRELSKPPDRVEELRKNRSFNKKVRGEKTSNLIGFIGA